MSQDCLSRLLPYGAFAPGEIELQLAIEALVPAVRIEVVAPRTHARSALGWLARAARTDAVALSKNCLDAISDPELRRMIEAMLFAAAAGGLLGVAVGGLAGGAACVQVGALVGVGVGFAAASVALALKKPDAEFDDA